MTNQELFGTALKEIRKILDQKKQIFFLVCGTFLGQYRDNKFIEDDADIDLGIFYNDLKPNIKEYILSFKEFILIEECGLIPSCYKLKFKYHNGIKIDIFIHYQYDVNKYYYATYLGLDGNQPIRLNKDNYIRWNNTIVGLTKTKFIKETFLVPENKKEYLIESYGEDFMIRKKYSYLEGLQKKEFKNIIIN